MVDEFLQNLERTYQIRLRTLPIGRPLKGPATETPTRKTSPPPGWWYGLRIKRMKGLWPSLAKWLQSSELEFQANLDDTWVSRRRNRSEIGIP